MKECLIFSNRLLYIFPVQVIAYLCPVHCADEYDIQAQNDLANADTASTDLNASAFPILV